MNNGCDAIGIVGGCTRTRRQSPATPSRSGSSSDGATFTQFRTVDYGGVAELRNAIALVRVLSADAQARLERLGRDRLLDLALLRIEHLRAGLSTLAVQQLVLPGADPERFGVRPGNVPEDRDPCIGTPLLQEPGQQGEVVVLHEHDRLLACELTPGALDGARGEADRHQLGGDLVDRKSVV